MDIQEFVRKYNIEADAQQLEVIKHAEGAVNLIATAGSGKTRTIINRILTNTIKEQQPGARHRAYRKQSGPPIRIKRPAGPYRQQRQKKGCRHSAR